jgi:hypothetical protein
LTGGDKPPDAEIPLPSHFVIAGALSAPYETVAIALPLALFPPSSY